MTELARGDRVFGLVGGGGYAEHVVVHARTLARIPEGHAVRRRRRGAGGVRDGVGRDGRRRARLAAGEVVLVHAAGSGVGTAAVQIARAVGARAIGTARTPQKVGARARARA